MSESVCLGLTKRVCADACVCVCVRVRFRGVEVTPVLECQVFQGGIWSCAALRDLSLCRILRHSHHRHTCILCAVYSARTHTRIYIHSPKCLAVKDTLAWVTRKRIRLRERGNTLNKSERKWSILRCSLFLSQSLSSFQTTPHHGTGPNPKAFVCSLAFPLSLFVYPFFLFLSGSFWWPSFSFSILKSFAVLPLFSAVLITDTVPFRLNWLLSSSLASVWPETSISVFNAGAWL